MIDHLMLRGLKPLSQETGIEDPNEDIEQLERIRNSYSMSRFLPTQNTATTEQEVPTNTEVVLPKNSNSNGASTGNYYTDSHLKQNLSEEDILNKQNEEAKQEFFNLYTDATEEDLVYTEGYFNKYASAENYFKRTSEQQKAARQYISPEYKAKIQKETAKSTFSLSNNLLANYYEGVEGLKKAGYTDEQLSSIIPTGENLSREQKNYELKKRIVSDALEHSITPEAQRLLKEYGNKVDLSLSGDSSESKYVLKSDLPEETLDFLYDKWLAIEGKNRIFKNNKRSETSEINQSNILSKHVQPSVFSNESAENNLVSLSGNTENTKSVLQASANRDVRAKAAAEQHTQYIENLSPEEKEKAVEEFKDTSKKVAPYYFGEFADTDKLPIGSEDYVQLMSEFYANLHMHGEEYATQILNDRYQAIVAENTSAWENTCSAVKQAGVNGAITAYGWAVKPIARTYFWATTSASWDAAGRGVDEALHAAQTMGTVLPWQAEEAYARYKEGLPGYQQRHYDPYNAGIGEDVGNLLESSGYMAGFVLGGGAIGKLTGGVAKLGSKVMRVGANVANANNAAKLAANLTWIASQEVKLGKIYGQLAMAAANSNLEASGASQDFIHSHKVQLDKELKQNYLNDLAKDITSDPLKWAEEYKKQTGVNLVSLASSPYEGGHFMQGFVSDEAKQILFDYFSNNKEVYNNYRNTNTQYQNQLKKVEHAADAAYTTTFTLNFLPELVFNTALRNVMLPKSMTRSFTGAQDVSEALTILRSGGKWNSQAKKVALGTIAKEYGKNILAETSDEFLEEIFSSTGTGVAESALEQMNQSRHGMYSTTGALAYDVATALSHGLYSGAETAFSKEALVSGVYGGISALVGLPAVKGSVDWSKRKDGESVMQFLQRTNPITWDAIWTLPFGINDRVKQEQAARDHLAEYVNAFLQDPEKQKMFENSAYATSLLNKLSVAQKTGDSKLISDAEAELATATMAMLAATKGTDYYTSITSAVDARANFSKDNLDDPNSAENQAVQEYLADQRIKGPVSREAVLEGIINAAKQSQKLLEEAEQEMKEAYELFGDDADLEFIQGVVQNKLTLKDRSRRHEAIDKRIEEFHEKNFVEDPTKSSKLSPEGKKMAAKFGTHYQRTSQGTKKYSAEAILEDYRNRASSLIAEIEADEQLSKTEKKSKIQQVNKWLEEQAKQVEVYRTELESLKPSEMVITAEEILNMDQIDQMKFLSRDDHSKEQKAEIKRLGSLKQDIITRGQLLQDINKGNNIATQLALNPSYMMDFHAKAKAKAKKEIFKIKYSHLNREGLSYEDFRKEYYDAAFNLESQEDAELLDATIADNVYAKQLREEQDRYTKIIHEVINTEEYGKISKDARKKANLDALLSYCVSNGIAIDPSLDFDTILQQIVSIDFEQLQKFLDRINTSAENKVLMSPEELAQMLKSTYNGVNDVRAGIEKRNNEPQDTDATNSNNGDRNQEVEEEQKESYNQEYSPSKPSEGGSAPPDKTLPHKKKDDEEEKDILLKEKKEKEESSNESVEKEQTEVTAEKLIQAAQAIQSEGSSGAAASLSPRQSEHTFNWINGILAMYNPKQQNKISAWGYLIDKSKTLPAKDQEALQPILAAMESKITGTSVEENYTQSVAIEGHTGRHGDFMRKHKSYATLAENEGVKEGAKLRFYTPKELSDAEGDLPVVALIESQDGSISLQGKRYAPIGFVTPTQSMRSQNPNRSKDGDFLYKESGTIQDVKKEGFAQEHHSKTSDIPVKEAMKSEGKTAKQIQEDFLSKVKVGKNNKGKTVLQYPVTRGTGNLTIDVEITPTSPSKVKNQDGKTIFEDAKEYRETKQSSTNKENVAESADKVINHNEYTKLASEVIDRLDKDGIIMTLSKNPKADVSSKLQQIWKNINSYLRTTNYDAYNLLAENVQVDNEGNVSFDLVLKLSSDKTTSFPLASITGVNARQGLTREQTADILTSLLLDSQGEEQGIIYPVSYTYKEGINIPSVSRAFRTGVLGSNKPSFAWPATSLSFKYNHERRSDGVMKAEGLSSNTDNAVTAHTSENTVTTTEGKKVDADTGISQDTTRESTPKIVERVVENQLTPEEIIETVAEEVVPVEDPFANTEEDYSSFDDDYEDEDEYQMVVSRKAKIAKVKEFFKSLIKDLEGKEVYNQVIEEATSEFEKYTKPGSFSIDKTKDRSKAKNAAEIQAEKIRSMKLPHVRSVKVVQDGDKGYSLQIKYNTYKRYLDLKAASAETMTDAALKATLEAFSDKQKVLNPTPEVAKKQLSIFQRFSAKNLKEKFNSLLSTPISEKFEHLLTEVLSLHGIKVMEKDIRESNGHDVLGAINTAGNIIYLAKGGNRNSITLAEETAHSFVKNIVRQGEKGDPVLWNLYQEISASIEETSLYQETLEEYRETYTDKDTGDVNYDKIKQEAIAKSMAVVMSEKYDNQNTILSTVSSLLDNTIEWVKTLLGNSSISNGAETILHNKLNNLVDQVMKKDVKQVKKQQRKEVLNVVLEALGINTKDKHIKSDAEKRIEQRQKDIVMNSSARTIRFDYLTENTKQTLNKMGIKQKYWQFYPIELQEQLLKCLSRA